MYHTTGFTRDEIVEVCAHVHAANKAAAESEKVTWPPILGLFMSVVVTLTYSRRSRIQAEIGESYGVSQSTISRAVTALTPLLGTALAGYVPVAEDLHPHAHYIVDGTGPGNNTCKKSKGSGSPEATFGDSSFSLQVGQVTVSYLHVET